MLIPYAVFFAAACAASLVAGTVKVRLLIHKWRSRLQTGEQTPRRSSLGGVAISPQLGSHKSVISLKERFDGRQLERYKYYTYLMAAVAEDIPMGRPALTPYAAGDSRAPAAANGLGRDHEHHLYCANDGRVCTHVREQEERQGVRLRPEQDARPSPEYARPLACDTA
jgi:hypothetical protein